MEYQVTANPEVVVAPKVEGDPAEPGLAKGVVKLPGVLFVAIATMAPGAGAAYSISTGALFGGGALALSVVFALVRSEEHTSELQSLRHLVCRLLLEKKQSVNSCTHAR